jgi:hypothetical protein
MADPNVYALSVQLSLDSASAFASMQEFGREAVSLEEAFAKAGAAGTKTIDEQVGLFAKIQKSLKDKNLLHEDQNKLLDEDVVLGEASNDQFDKMPKAVKKTTKEIMSATSRMWSFIEAVESATEITEDFKDANYRAYGGIEQLTINANTLSSGYGVLGSEARAAYKALADVRTPRDEIDKLAGAVARTSRETGVGAQVLATYVRRLRATGTTGDEATAHLEKMTEAMRKNGLTTEDMNRVMGDTAVSAGLLNMVFGEGSAADFTSLKAQFDGVAKSMGLAADSGSQMFNEMMNNEVAMMKMQGTSGVLIDSVEDMGLAFARSAQKIGPQIAGLNATIAAGGPGKAQALVAAKALAKGYGYVSADAMFLSHKLNEQAKEMGITIKTQEDLNKVMEATQAQAMSNESASDSFNRQMKLLKDSFQKVFSTVMIFVGQALIPFMKVVLAVIQPIAWVIQKIASLMSGLFNLTSGLGTAGDAINAVVAGLIAFGIYMLATSTAVATGLTWIGTAFAWLSTTASTAMATVGTALTGFGTKVMTTFTTMGTAIATSLNTMAAAVAPNIIVIMQMALALLMVAAAAWIFAQAVKIIAEVGWAAVPAIAGIAVAILVLGGILIFLGSLCQGPVAVGMLVLGVTLLMVAVSVWLIASAINMAADAMQKFVDVLVQLSGGVLIDFAVAIITAAPMILLAGIMLLIAAVFFAPAAIAIGIGAMLLGYGLKLLAEGAKAMEDVDLIAVALQLLGSAGMLWLAAWAFAPAAIAIGIGAIFLGFGLKLLATGVKAMKGVDLIAVAEQLLGSAGMLWVAAWAFAPAALAIGIGAIFLGFGLKLLAGGAKAMEGVDLLPVAEKLLIASGPLLLAAIPLLLAGIVLLPAALLLWITAMFIGGIGEKMVAGADNLAKASVHLLKAGQNLIVAGPAILLGSLALIVGSVFLFVASVILFVASFFLIIAAYGMYAGVKLLSWAIKDFVKQSDNILKMSKGVYTLAKAMTMLSKLEMKSIGSEIADALSGISKLGDLADKLQSVAAKFKTAANTLKGPVNAIVAIFSKLNSVLDGFHKNVQNIGSDIDKLTTAVENHADLMENAAERVNVAVGAKVAPAMSEAERIGINDVVRAETIQQVQVAVTTEGEEPGIADGQVALLAIMRDQLVDLNDNVRKISESSAADDIYELCARYLPSMAGKKEGLSSELNEYMS